MNRQLLVPLIVVLLTLSAKVCLAVSTTLAGITNEYRFDDGSGTIAVDSVGGDQAVLHNFGAGTPWIVGKFGSGVNYLNENAYVITDSPIAASSASQFSVSFWSRLNSKPNSNDSVLVTPQLDNWVTYNPTGNTNGLGKRGIGVGAIRDPNEPVLGVWENYVITYDRPSSFLSVYRNGVLRDTGDVALPSLNTQWVFGHNQGPDNTNGSWHGALDEIQFYNRVLTVSEIQMLLSDPHPQGDYNRNGVVDAADYVVWRHDVGNTVPACSGADANCNTFVENSEYQVWRNNYGRLSTGSGTAVGSEFGAPTASIPEPTSFLLSVLGIVIIASSEMRKRRPILHFRS
jgi:hypothetical protein